MRSIGEAASELRVMIAIVAGYVRVQLTNVVKETRANDWIVSSNTW